MSLAERKRVARGWVLGVLVVGMSAFRCGGRSISASSDANDAGGSGATGTAAGTSAAGSGGSSSLTGGPTTGGDAEVTGGASGTGASAASGGLSTAGIGTAGGTGASNGSSVSASTGASAVTSGSTGYCSVGEWTFKAGQVIPRDCNTCACNEDGSLSCTQQPCPCVDRTPAHALNDAIPAGLSSADGLPACIPTCGASPHAAGDATLSLDALPTGTCDHFTDACVISAHAGCECPDEPGPVGTYVCSCAPDFTWACSLVSMPAGACTNACLGDAGTAQGDAGQCALTQQLSLSAKWDDQDGDGFLMPGETVTIVAQLTNAGPADLDGYPGLELTMSTPGSPANDAVLARNAVASLAKGQTAEIRLKTVVPSSVPLCSEIGFTIRVRTFGGSEAGCAGNTLDVPVILSNATSCSACGADLPLSANGTPCSVPSSECRSESSRGALCTCDGTVWTCRPQVD